MNINIRQQSYLVGLGVWKTRGQQNKRGDPLCFLHTPLAGGCKKKKWGAKRKGGARTPRTPPEYAPGPYRSKTKYLSVHIEYFIGLFTIKKNYHTFDFMTLSYVKLVRGLSQPISYRIIKESHVE